MEKTVRKKKTGLALSVALNLLLCIALIITAVFLSKEKASSNVLAANVAVQQEIIDNEMIPLETFQKNAADFNVSTEFIQRFFTDKIVYKDESGIVYADVDESLPKNSYNWENLVREENKRIRYLDDGAKVGIDVSKYQGEIDWEKVKADGIDYAILRLGYRGYGTGKMVLDETYEDNLENAEKAGMDIGVYYFTQAITPEEAVEEAEMVLEYIKGHRILYPVIVDIEDVPSGEARTAGLTRDEITEILIAFCERIKQEGYTPMIYANTKWLVSKMDLARLTDYDKWLAQYYRTPFFPYEFHMWQYSSTGTVDGIEGNVDLNICFRDYTGGARE